MLNISGSTTKTFQGTINNRGVVTWSGSGPINAGGVGVFNNQSGGLFNVQGDASYQYAYNPQPSFTNAGTFRKSAGAGTTAFNSVPFSNTGTVEVQAGTLSFNNAFQQQWHDQSFERGGTGADRRRSERRRFDVASGASVSLNGGSFTFSPGMTFTGSGFFGVSGGINLTGDSGIANFNLTASGSIGGTFTNSGTMNWTGGGLNATMSIGPSGVLNISGSTTKNFQGTINNRGVVTWSGSGPINAGGVGVFNNQSGGLFNVQG